MTTSKPISNFPLFSLMLFSALMVYSVQAFLSLQEPPRLAKCLAAPPSASTTVLFMSLKPAAIPLMDSGKAMARSGEVLIDLSKTMDLYGGGLSSAGAELRNAGDAVAQAAASARFKTGAEIVIDELRESGTCLQAAAEKLRRAVQEAEQDKDLDLAATINTMIGPFCACGELLEDAGATVMRREAPSVTGERLSRAGALLTELSSIIPTILEGDGDGTLSSQRLAYAAEKMTEAGNSLRGMSKKPTGKSWLKGGGGL